jgi:hypothetical protein
MNLEAVMKWIAVLSTATLIATLASSGAYALSNRTFVSGNGSDNNPCSIAAPCRSFAGAIAQTSPGGEVAVLDTAGYGAVTITKAITIVNEEGVEGGITVTSGDAITINAGVGDTVNLRGLTLVDAGSGGSGITFNSGRVLNIQNCVIRGFGNSNGLSLLPTGSADINVSNTIVSGNSRGIFLQPTGTNATVTASFEQVQAIDNDAHGFLVDGSLMTGGSLHALAADSLASGNGNTGFLSNTGAGHGVTIFTLSNSKAANNNMGLAGTGGTMFLNASTVSGNTNLGFLVAGGVINSYGNNAITDTNNQGILTGVALR